MGLTWKDVRRWGERVLYFCGSAMLLWWLPRYLKFRRGLDRPLHWQEKKLLALLAANRDTEYGRAYGFGEIRSIAQFQERVPVVDYGDLEPYIQRQLQGEKNVLTHQDPKLFLLTSGTTGRPKYIPVTEDFEREFHSPLWSFSLIRKIPSLGYFNSILPIVNPEVKARTPAGVPFGAASGHIFLSQNKVVGLTYALPYAVYALNNWDAKNYAMIRLSLENQVRLLITANPGTFLTLVRRANDWQDLLVRDLEDGRLTRELPFEPHLRRELERGLRPNPVEARRLRAAAARRGGRLDGLALWPLLRGLCCWLDGSARFYLPQLHQVFGGLPVHSLGYLASEGRGSLPLGPGGAGVLAVSSHFFEFIPEEEVDLPGRRVLTCDQLETGRHYYMLFTAANGLYRYFINDVVRVTGFCRRTPLIEFAYKGGNLCSFTGEKISEAQVEGAMAAALARLGLTVRDYVLIPTFADPPYYCLAVEWGGEAHREQGPALARELDGGMFRQNILYEKRRLEGTLAPVFLRELPPGFFEAFLRYRVEVEGAHHSQVKIPHLNPGEPLLGFLKKELDFI